MDGLMTQVDMMEFPGRRAGGFNKRGIPASHAAASNPQTLGPDFRASDHC
jgi:hypothetical protein